MMCEICANDGCWCCLECQKSGSHYVSVVAVNARKLRKKLGYSIRELALCVGVSASTVFRWENGKAEPTSTNLYWLAITLCVGIEELFRKDEEKQ